MPVLDTATEQRLGGSYIAFAANTRGELPVELLQTLLGSSAQLLTLGIVASGAYPMPDPLRPKMRERLPSLRLKPRLRRSIASRIRVRSLTYANPFHASLGADFDPRDTAKVAGFIGRLLVATAQRRLLVAEARALEIENDIVEATVPYGVDKRVLKVWKQEAEDRARHRQERFEAFEMAARIVEIQRRLYFDDQDTPIWSVEQALTYLDSEHGLVDGISMLAEFQLEAQPDREG